MRSETLKRQNIKTSKGEWVLKARGQWLSGLLIVLCTLLVYIPAMRAAYIWDDDAYVTGNAALRTPGGLEDIWFTLGATPQYYPLVFTTFWIEYRFWELKPLGYHVDNVLLHALGAVLLWRILKRLQIPGAWLAAAVFALHPMHVESVAWVTERKNVLSGVFYFLSLMTYMRFSNLPGPIAPAKYDWSKYVAALAFFVCALLSKTVTCSLPAVIVLLLWWKRERLSGRDLWPLLPFFVVGLSLAMTTTWVEKHHVGAEGAEWSLTAIERCLVAGRVLWFYAGKLIWPWPLIFIYPRWVIQADAWWQYLFPLAALTAIAGLWVMRRDWGKGPLVAALFFSGTLVPASGFINVYPMRYSFVADHFQYLASIGVIVPIAVIIVRAITMLKMRAIFVTGLLLLLGVMTWRQGWVYRDAETLWRDVLAKNPNAWIAWNNLGLLLEEHGVAKEAADHYAAAIQLNPDYPEAHNNLAIILFRQGRFDEAIDHSRKALSVRPTFTNAHNTLAMALHQKGSDTQAINQLNEALRIDPASFETHNNLASILVKEDKIDDAITHLRKAVRLKENSIIAHQNLAMLLAKQNKTAEAVSELREVLRLDPNQVEARFNLAMSLANQGQTAEAVQEFREVLRAQPDDADAHFHLGKLLVQQGRRDEGVHEYQQALRIDPQHAEAKQALAQ